jgi:hypothetical protein
MFILTLDTNNANASFPSPPWVVGTVIGWLPETIHCGYTDSRATLSVIENRASGEYMSAPNWHIA